MGQRVSLNQEEIDITVEAEIDMVPASAVDGDTDSGILTVGKSVKDRLKNMGSLTCDDEFADFAGLAEEPEDTQITVVKDMIDESVLDPNDPLLLKGERRGKYEIPAQGFRLDEIDED